MEKRNAENENRFLALRKKQKNRSKIFRVLAGLVVFWTTYALILPAITMVQPKKELTCPVNVHTHTEACYDQQHQLICGKADFVVHVHDESCYNSENELICTLTEIKPHVHDESCYAKAKVPVCTPDTCPGQKDQQTEDLAARDDDFLTGNAEAELASSDFFSEDSPLPVSMSEEDIHSESCYEEVEVLSCTNPAVLHRHTLEDCYEKIEQEDGTVEYRMTCTEPEVLEHQHNAGCFTVIQEERIPVEAEDYERIVENTEPSEESAPEENVETIERIEDTENLKETEDSEEIEESEDPEAAENEDASEEDEETENPEDAENEEEELPEDEASEDAEDGEDSENEDEEESDEEEVEDEFISNFDFERVFEGADYTITVRFNEDAEIPEEAELQVQELFQGSQEYQSCYEEVAELLGIPETEEVYNESLYYGDEFTDDFDDYGAGIQDLPVDDYSSEDDSEEIPDYDFHEEEPLEITEIISFARFFDISFMMEGGKIEPAAAVDITISYADPVQIADENQAVIVHFAEEGTEILDVAVTGNDVVESNEVDTFHFSQESFSVTGTVVTTDTLPVGKQYIMYVQSGNKYYALAKNSNNNIVPVEVRVSADGNTVICDTDRDDILWTLESRDSGSTVRNYFFNASNSSKRYLRINANGVSTTSTRTGVRIGQMNNGSARLYDTNTFLGRTYYHYLRYTNNSFTEDSQSNATYVHFATYFVADQPEVPNLVDPSIQPTLEGNYEHNKYIDYLGDGIQNGLTTLTGEDFYRISLDMTGIRKPVDLLMVIDASGSMKKKVPSNVSSNGYTHGMPEVIKFLNGVVGSDDYNHNVDNFNDSSCDGFIHEFFELNNRNRMAIAAFGGYDTSSGSYHQYSSNSSYRYTADAWRIKDWNTAGTTYNSVPVATGYYPDYTSTNRPNRTKRKEGAGLYIEEDTWTQGTNYSAGLMLAQEMMSELTDTGEDRIKIMVFLSDGMPTYSIVNTTNTSYPLFHGTSYMRRGQGSERYYGNGNNDRDVSYNSQNQNNTRGDTYYDSERTFDTYQNVHSDVINYSIAFRVDSGADDVLKYMGSTDAARTNGVNFKAASNYTEIMDMIIGVFKPRDVSITDRLSADVSFYQAQPDVKVTMTPKEGGTPKILWEGYNEDGHGIVANNKFTYHYYDEDNHLVQIEQNIVESVTFYDTADGQQISVQFNEHYPLDQKYTYALSFNVQATDHAYDTYAEHGYSVNGDSGTDATGNVTSSGQPGLRSNAIAVARYIGIEGDHEHSMVGYKHPVIQVDKCQLTVIKTDNKGVPLSNVSFNLKRGDTDLGTFNVDANGQVTIPSECLLTGSYKLTEISAPEDYIKIEDDITFSVKQGMIDYPPQQTDTMWKWGEKPAKVIELVNGNTAYPKNQIYEYDLTIKNKKVIQKTEILLQKTDINGNPLNDAKFVLYQDVSDIDPQPEGAITLPFVIEGTETNKTVLVIADNLTSHQEQITLPTASDQESGTVTVNGLIYYNNEMDEGTYYLYEKEAPTGYNRLTEAVVIQATADEVIYKYKGSPITRPVTAISNDDFDNSDFTFEMDSAQIINTEGYTLPQTGGTGTRGFTIGGWFLISASLLYGFYLRQSRERRITNVS